MKDLWFDDLLTNYSWDTHDDSLQSMLNFFHFYGLSQSDLCINTIVSVDTKVFVFVYTNS